MPTTKKKAVKKKKKINPLLLLLIIVALIFLLSMAISYFLSKDNNPLFNPGKAETDTLMNLHENSLTDQIKFKTPLEGIWVSRYDGALLSIQGLIFTLEIPSVEASEKINGEIAVDNTIVTFFNKNGIKSCLDIEGHYQFVFEGQDLSFKLIKDACPSRIERMSAGWYKL